jgi:hypothetical protein
VTVTISVATKATAETTKQKDNKDDDEYGSDRLIYLRLLRLPTLTERQLI